MKGRIEGIEVEIVDLAVDPSDGLQGFAVRYPGGKEELVCAGMVEFNPSPSDFAALGAVELDQAGYPDVVALRGEKIPKKEQLSRVLGVPVGWEAREKIGFFIEEGDQIIPLGYSFDDALRNANFMLDMGLARQEMDRLSGESDALKWGALPGTVAGAAFNPSDIHPDILKEIEHQASRAEHASDQLWSLRNTESYMKSLPPALRSGLIAENQNILRRVQSMRRAEKAGHWALVDDVAEDIRRDAELILLRLPEREAKPIQMGLFNPSFGPVTNNPDRRFPSMPDREGMIVQSILFPIDEWSAQTAKKWLREHDFTPSNVDRGESVIRFRQIEPSKIEPGTWSTIQFGESGIQAVVGVPAGGVDPDMVQFNPWGETVAGERVLWAREIGPAQEDLLSSAVGQSVKYFFPGQTGSPDKSKGGFYAGSKYLGESFSSAYSSIFGDPWQEIETGLLDTDLAKFSSLGLSSGVSVLEAVKRSAGSFEDFLTFLDEKERQDLASAAVSAGFDGGLQALHSYFLDSLQVWQENIAVPIKLNPQRYFEVIGKTGPIGFSADTTTGTIQGSDQYKGLAGLVAGPELGFQRDLTEDLIEIERGDFSTLGEAWSQFYNLNSPIASGIGAQGVILHERDSSGNTYEAIKEFYGLKRPITTLEQAIKTIVKNERIKSWDQFPGRFLLDSLPSYASWVKVPFAGEERLSRLQVPDISSGGRSAIEGALDRSIDGAVDRFRLLRSSWDLLGYFFNAGLLSAENMSVLSSGLESITTGGLNYDEADFSEFASFLMGAIDYGSDIPF